VITGASPAGAKAAETLRALVRSGEPVDTGCLADRGGPMEELAGG
jgi:hypothetical protein